MPRPLLLALLMGGCAAEPTPPTSVDPPAGPVAESSSTPDEIAEAGGAEWQRVRIERFECGDNCYLVVRPIEGKSEPVTALCVADVCTDWNAAVEMPDEWVDRVVEVVFGTGAQLNGGGAAMDAAHPAVVAIRRMDG